jgi:hypothetical protein
MRAVLQIESEYLDLLVAGRGGAHENGPAYSEVYEENHMFELDAVVTDAAGSPMPYSSQLSSYLRQRNSRGNAKVFVIGEWLRSLSSEELAVFIEFADQSLEHELPGQNTVPGADIMMVAIISLAVEQNNRNVAVAAELPLRVHHFATLEQLSREGFIVIDHPLSMTSDPTQTFTLTDKGKATGIQLQRAYQ